MNDTDISNFIFFLFVIVIFLCLVKSCYNKFNNDDNEHLQHRNIILNIENQIPPKYEDIGVHTPPPAY